MVTFAAAAKNTPSFPTRAPAPRRVSHFVAITCSVPRDSCDSFKADCQTLARLVSPSRDPIGYRDGPSAYNAYFVLSKLDPTGLACSRKVCCKFRLGWLISEFETKELDCGDGHSASECCDSWGSRWYRLWATDAAYDGACVRTDEPVKALAPTPVIAPIASATGIVPKAHPLVWVCAGVIYANECFIDHQPYELPETGPFPVPKPIPVPRGDFDNPDKFDKEDCKKKAWEFFHICRDLDPILESICFMILADDLKNCEKGIYPKND